SASAGVLPGRLADTAVVAGRGLAVQLRAGRRVARRAHLGANLDAVLFERLADARGALRGIVTRMVHCTGARSRHAAIDRRAVSGAVPATVAIAVASAGSAALPRAVDGSILSDDTGGRADEGEQDDFHGGRATAARVPRGVIRMSS